MLRNVRVRSIVIATVVLLAASLISATALAAAEPAAQTQQGGDLSLLAETLGDRVHPDILRNAPIDTSLFEPILQELGTAHSELSTSKETKAELTRTLNEQNATKENLRVRVETALIDLGSAAEARVEASEGLKIYALSNFKDRPTPMWLDALSTGKVAADLGLPLELEADLTATESSLRTAHENAEGKSDRLAQRLDEVSVALEMNAGKLDDADRRTVELEARIETLAPQLVAEVLLAPLRGLPFPVVVLDAYYRAQLTTAQFKPRCDVSWHQLAGIGQVETIHGTYLGRSVEHDGRTSTPITGPELNGNPFLAISDTDGGLLDNNSVWDHAVGPMQFIPTSWQLYGADGNGDGINDPHNMYDATLAAANHLCGSRSQLSDTDNFTAALFGYNRSISYGISVKGHANSYGSALSLG